MYSLVLLMAMNGGPEVPTTHPDRTPAISYDCRGGGCGGIVITNSCYGGCTGCYGSVIYSGNCTGCTGCHGTVIYSGSCTGCSGCHGSVIYSSGCSGCHGCHGTVIYSGGCTGCHGNCTGCHGYAANTNWGYGSYAPTTWSEPCTPATTWTMPPAGMIIQSAPVIGSPVETVEPKVVDPKVIPKVDPKLDDRKSMPKFDDLKPLPKFDDPKKDDLPKFEPKIEPKKPLVLVPANAIRSVVRVELPAGAKLFVNDMPNEIASSNNLFETPALTAGAEYAYTFKAVVDVHGEKREIARRVSFKAGDTVRVDLREAETAGN